MDPFTIMKNTMGRTPSHGKGIEFLNFLGHTFTDPFTDPISFHGMYRGPYKLIFCNICIKHVISHFPHHFNFWSIAYEIGER